MNTILEHITGLHTLTDEVIAMDFLINTKSEVRNYAMAVTECATPRNQANFDETARRSHRLP